jgi:hypothetical protein
MADSPSEEPDTHSPNALLDGPITQQAVAPNTDGNITVQNGIVSFGK